MRKAPQTRQLNHYQNVLESVLLCMLRDKAREADVRTAAMRAIDHALCLSKMSDEEINSEPRIFGAVLYEWHRNHEYLGKDALPKAIPLVGPAPSVVALVRTQSRDIQAEFVANNMATLRLLKRTGKNLYLPLGRTATIRRLGPQITEHVARSCGRLLATVNANVRTPARRASLIERAVYVHDLPSSDVAAFRRFAQEQGTAFLENADDWLESRRATKRSRRGRKVVRAGVHLFAFEGAPGARPTNRM